jgi:PIN domain nuclease of toxin-antitoxin system
MRLLIDTHALLWFCQGSSSLSDAARTVLEDEKNTRFVSHAVPWEIAIKLSLGKLQIHPGYEAIFPSVLDANGFALLLPKLEHYRGVVTLPRHHGDPFDRLMIVQAQIEGLTIVTCDPQFTAYGVPLIW